MVQLLGIDDPDLVLHRRNLRKLVTSQLRAPYINDDETTGVTCSREASEYFRLAVGRVVVDLIAPEQEQRNALLDNVRGIFRQVDMFWAFFVLHTEYALIQAYIGLRHFGHGKFTMKFHSFRSLPFFMTNWNQLAGSAIVLDEKLSSNLKKSSLVSAFPKQPSMTRLWRQPMPNWTSQRPSHIRRCLRQLGIFDWGNSSSSWVQIMAAIETSSEIAS
jgi:hypothetical protein